MKHMIQNLIQMLVLHASSNEFYHLDLLPIEFIKEFLQIYLLQIDIDQLYRIIDDFSLRICLLGSSIFQFFYIFILLLLRIDNNSSPCLYILDILLLLYLNILHKILISRQKHFILLFFFLFDIFTIVKDILILQAGHQIL